MFVCGVGQPPSLYIGKLGIHDWSPHRILQHLRSVIYYGIFYYILDIKKELLNLNFFPFLYWTFPSSRASTGCNRERNRKYAPHAAKVPRQSMPGIPLCQKIKGQIWINIEKFSWLRYPLPIKIFLIYRIWENFLFLDGNLWKLRCTFVWGFETSINVQFSNIFAKFWHTNAKL